MVSNVLAIMLMLVCTLEAKRCSEENDLFSEAHSNNFVIRWAFQDLCDFVYDPRTNPWPTPTNTGKTPTFNPAEVKPGDMIFVRDALWFFRTEGKKITVPYFILTAGEYLDSFKEDYFRYLDNPLILGWFTVHPHKKQHERVFAIPLGILQYHDLYTKRAEAHKKFLNYRKAKKKKLLYMNITDWRNPARKKIRELFKDKPFCSCGDFGPFERYLKETAEHKFSIAPPGLGPDLYRIYECLLVGTIPIVQHSYMDWLYEGLPILFVDDWEAITREYLEQQYAQLTARKYNPEKLYMEYWIDYIATTRERLFNKYNERQNREGAQ